MNDAAGSRPPLDPEALDARLGGSRAVVELLAMSPSTNAVAAERARAGAPEGLVVVADHQSAGRGRLDRQWETPPRAALTFTVLLRPVVAPGAWPWLPLLTGYAVRGALAAHGVGAGLKWPNDVLLGEHKVAGILVERVETEHGPAAVVGIGINVSTRAEELPVPTATSIELATGVAPDRHELFADLVLTLLAEYDAWQDDGAADLRRAYRDACVSIGRQVRVELPGGRTVTGQARGVDDEGRLLVDHDDGPLVVGAGDVVHVRAVDR